MFRSVSNLKTLELNVLPRRQRHDFLDDLESFFWVYAWMMTRHNGPGVKRVVPNSKLSEDAMDWEMSLDPWFHRSWKHRYMETFGERMFRVFTPYFSKPVYRTLLHSLRELLYGYCDRKMTRPKDAHGRWQELDFFSEMDEIYSKVLDCFDVAIKALAPARTQPNRQAKLVKRRRDEESNPPSLTKAKKARVEPSVRQPKRQRDDDPTPSSLPRSKKARIDPPHIIPPTNAVQDGAPSVPLNLRRSGRLKTGR